MAKVLCSPPGSETESEAGVKEERGQRSAEGTNRVQGTGCREQGAGYRVLCFLLFAFWVCGLSDVDAEAFAFEMLMTD